jgi:hypothetical protein
MQNYCRASCAAQGRGTSRGLEHCYTSDSNGGYPTQDGGTGGFCAPCVCTGAVDSGVPGCGNVTINGQQTLDAVGFCADQTTYVWCDTPSDKVAVQNCAQSFSTCDVHGAAGCGL